MVVLPTGSLHVLDGIPLLAVPIASIAWVPARSIGVRTSMQEPMVGVVLADDEISRRVVLPVIINVVDDGLFRQNTSESLLGNLNVHIAEASARIPFPLGQ